MPQLGDQIREDPLAIFPRIARKLHSLWLQRTYPFASVGRRVSIHYSCDLRRSTANRVKIGNDVILSQDVWINIPNVPDTQEPIIILEDGCAIGRRAVISARNQIHIMRNTIFGPSVLVMDHNHGFEDVTRPIRDQGETRGGTIRIEEGCWIGFGAAIVCSQGELVIGKGSVIGANSVLTRSVPPFSVVIGNPSRVVKQFDPSKETWTLGSVAANTQQATSPANK
jgi:acetyltransferase-like isoleucine patch superfamily enzyme